MTPEERAERPQDEQKDQTALRRRLVVGSFFFAAILALIYGTVRIIQHYHFLGYGGDTPVVLIGGSVVVKQGSTDTKQNWSPHDNGYQTTSAHPIAWIALKKSSSDGKGDAHDPDDDDATTDQLPAVPVSSAVPWNVGLYTDEGNKDPNLIIAFTPGSGIQLTVGEFGGSLCPNNSGRRIRYISGNCKADLKDQKEYTFAYAMVNSNVASTKLPCTDSNGTKNRCRIVIRYPKTN
jgi:hypothetical protein